jgi:hypothetical protein
MWRFFLTVFLGGIMSWVVLDAIYWGSGDFTGLFPDHRYFVVITIAVVVALTLWVVFWGVRKLRQNPHAGQSLPGSSHFHSSAK